MGWNKIKEWLCHNFSPVTTKQHVASMSNHQQQKTTDALQEYMLTFSDLLLKSSTLSSLLPHQAKNLAHITHFIHNLHNQKLEHYVLSKIPISVQNAIIPVQKPKRMQSYALLKACIIMIQDRKLTTFIINNMRITKVIWDLAKLVTDHI